jgi:hypothetical protein
VLIQDAIQSVSHQCGCGDQIDKAIVFAIHTDFYCISAQAAKEASTQARRDHCTIHENEDSHKPNKKAPDLAGRGFFICMNLVTPV